MTEFLKPNRALQALLEEPALTTSSNPIRALAHTITEVKSFGTGTAEIKLQRVREVDANGVDISLEQWAPTNIPKIGAVANAAQADAAKVSLSGESTIVISSPDNADIFGAEKDDLRVILQAPASTTAGGCIHPSKTVPYSAEVVSVVDGNAITAKLSLPSAEGYRVPQKGKGKLFVINTSQQVQSEPFIVEIV